MSHTACPTENTEILHKKIESLNDICFPWKRRKIRSTDHPWITDNIRRAIRRRRRRYKKYKRDGKWRSIKQEVGDKIKKNKREYYEKEAERAGTPEVPGIPYKTLKHITDPDKKQAWTVRDLRPDKSEEEIAEELSDFFSEITDQFIPLDGRHLPVTYSSPLSPVEPHDVAKRIREGRKPLSAVEGDPIPSTITTVSDLLAIPTTRIINASFGALVWPRHWKLETQSAIPKTGKPQSFNDLRNISCTNYLSKIMESYLLERLMKEVKIKKNQYGGLKGTGTTHYLIDTYQRVLDCLDDGQSAVSLVSIDFSKAFNRMCHHTCIDELAKRGASTESIALTASFLTGRQMRVKVGSSRSPPRFVRGGSPQGTKVGNYLFTITIESIEEMNNQLVVSPPPTITDDPPRPPPTLTGTPLRPATQMRTRRFAAKPIGRFLSGEFTGASTPVKASTVDGILRYWDESGRADDSARDDLILHEQPPQTWTPESAWTIKYVDDLTAGEHHYLRSATSTFTTMKEHKELHANDCEAIFQNVTTNSRRIGMCVNEQKTHLICIAPPGIQATVSSYMIAGENTLESEPTMKMLGFMIDNKAGMGAHITHLKRKVGAKMWLLIHLKRVGIEADKLARIFTTVIRPIIEYACQLYHHMINSEQSETIEALQRRALKIISGPGVSYRSSLESLKLERLSDRREILCRKFAVKASVNPRYKDWFPENEQSAYDFRKRRKYREDTVLTTRRQNGPVSQMRKILNEINY